MAYSTQRTKPAIMRVVQAARVMIWSIESVIYYFFWFVNCDNISMALSKIAARFSQSSFMVSINGLFDSETHLQLQFSRCALRIRNGYSVFGVAST